jgi:tetratricopeptide (TPR) repeat protein
MNPILRENLLKGVFLGLWAYLAVAQPPAAPDWPRFWLVIGITGAGFGIGLLVGAGLQVARGFRPGRHPAGFLLAVLMESPLWIYLGVVGGLGVGVVADRVMHSPTPDKDWLAYFSIGGAVLGYGFYQLRQVTDWAWRFGLATAIGAALVYVALEYLALVPGLDDPAARANLGVYLLIGLPFFLLLAVCGETDVSEIEIAAFCAGLGIGLDLLGLSSGSNLFAGKLILLVPLLLYVACATRFLPKFRAFRHTLRGFSALHGGRHIEAIVAFKNVLRIEPRNPLATEGLWTLHQRVDVTKLPPDAELLKHLDYDFCLERASAYLLGERPPTGDERAKAFAMLDLVERQRPALLARVDYLRTVGLTHAKQFDEAAGYLARLLNPETPYESAVRKPVLFPAWDLALRLHPELVKRLGPAELARPGRRMEAIGATERRLAEAADDPAAGELKTVLYAGLSEEEFVGDAASGPPTDFNYDYVEQIGLALADDADPAKRDRGMAFLRIAGRGLPHRGPGIFARLADLAAKLGRADEARGYREQVKRSGLLVGGPRALADDQRALYFEALKALAADEEARGDYEAAVGDLRLYMEGGRNELETYRKMADLYEKGKDPLNALLMTETGLVYNGKDRDLLARKDKYYYSVEPARLAGVKDKVEPFFDVDYCVRKARQVLDQREADVDLIDWSLHLTRLAKVMRPQNQAVRYAEARGLLRKGEKEPALQILEDLHDTKPGSGDEEDAWYGATKTLGDLYLNEFNRPDLAVKCYLDYRDYSKSGADTLFQIARCYEAMGDTKNALTFYETVTAYDQHPRYWEATEAVRRLKQA